MIGMDKLACWNNILKQDLGVAIVCREGLGLGVINESKFRC